MTTKDKNTDLVTAFEKATKDTEREIYRQVDDDFRRITLRPENSDILGDYGAVALKRADKIFQGAKSVRFLIKQGRVSSARAQQLMNQSIKANKYLYDELSVYLHRSHDVLRYYNTIIPVAKKRVRHSGLKKDKQHLEALKERRCEFDQKIKSIQQASYSAEAYVETGERLMAVKAIIRQHTSRLINNDNVN